AVTVADIDQSALDKVTHRNPAIQTIHADLSDQNRLGELIQPFDLVLNAVPGFMGYTTTECILRNGKNTVDISFFPENALELDALAKEKGLTAIVDCGVAPGMDNIILGHYDQRMTLDTFECLVGGLPKVRRWPFAYKAPFSPIDVLEEYTRPARYVENSVTITRPALSDPEYVEFDKCGTLESFNTDGLRSIIFTMPHIPNMKEKTLRYPGHIEYVRVLRETGFFSQEAIDVNGQQVVPLDFTSKLLFKDWKLGDTEPEFTVMRVTVEGQDGDQRKRVQYDLYDEYDPATQTSSMARTTGYSATAAVNLFMDGRFTEKGVFPPELVGKHEGVLQYFLDYMGARGIEYRKTETVL
ncbi:MAG: saccharopine dehydrogenase C-terminal domain-containing protein, partial [Bacteroidota bacterium]